MSSRTSGDDWGIMVPFFLIAMAVALVGFWPAMVWHGYTDTGGWRWDIHSTIAEGVYAGLIVLFSLLIWTAHRPPMLPNAPPDLDGSIRAARGAIEEDERGGPLRDLRDVANEEEFRNVRP